MPECKHPWEYSRMSTVLDRHRYCTACGRVESSPDGVTWSECVESTDGCDECAGRMKW